MERLLSVDDFLYVLLVLMERMALPVEAKVLIESGLTPIVSIRIDREQIMAKDMHLLWISLIRVIMMRVHSLIRIRVGLLLII